MAGDRNWGASDRNWGARAVSRLGVRNERKLGDSSLGGHEWRQAMGDRGPVSSIKHYNMDS